MLKDCRQENPIPAQLRRLAEQMECTHRALLAFDGADFHRQAMEELRLSRELETLVSGIDDARNELVVRLIRLCRIRHVLLRSTQRTVRAVWGVCAISRPTYEPLSPGSY